MTGWKSEKCFLKEINGKIIAEIVAKMIRDFHLKEGEELLLMEKRITQEDIITINSNISLSIYYAV